MIRSISKWACYTFAFLLLVLATVSTPQVANAQNYVKDDSYKDPEFVRFKLQLVSAVLRKDTVSLFKLMGPVVYTSETCSPVNVNCFKKKFRNAEIWNELYSMISYGFARNKLKQHERNYGKKGEIVFQTPYYHGKFDDADYQYLLVLGEYVNIREKPTIYSKVLRRSTYEKLAYNDPAFSSSNTASVFEDGKQWFEVILPDGTLGYLVEDYASARINHEMSIKKVDGRYKIISFSKREAPGC